MDKAKRNWRPIPNAGYSPALGAAVVAVDGSGCCYKLGDGRIVARKRVAK